MDDDDDDDDDGDEWGRVGHGNRLRGHRAGRGEAG